MDTHDPSEYYDLLDDDGKSEYEKALKTIKQQHDWYAQGLCPYCGGNYSLFGFGNKCKNCGTLKDVYSERKHISI